jgi:hypothetical protein
MLLIIIFLPVLFVLLFVLVLPARLLARATRVCVGKL